MESPPSNSTWSEAFMLSDDSGLLLTSGSISSGSMSCDSLGYNRAPFELQDSDCEVRSLSRIDSLDGMSDIMCGENFNTLKKGPHWNEIPLKYTPIEPPEQFQDKPVMMTADVSNFAERLAFEVIGVAIREARDTEQQMRLANMCVHKPVYHLLARSYWTQDFLPFSPCHTGRPSSRSSLGSSRLSSSHNSLTVPSARRVDDSNFITQAVSHDTLSSNQISDLYNVPFDSDVYSVPVDVVKPQTKSARKKRRNTSSSCREWNYNVLGSCKKSYDKIDRAGVRRESKIKRHSVAGSSTPEVEPIHMTLQEVRQYLQTLYSSSSDSSETRDKNEKTKDHILRTNNNRYSALEENVIFTQVEDQTTIKTKRTPFFIKNKKPPDVQENPPKPQPSPKQTKQKKTANKFFSLRQTLCNVFRLRRFISPERTKLAKDYNYGGIVQEVSQNNTISNRALPPLPSKDLKQKEILEEQVLDFTTSIQKVKDYGWYWGPLSSEAAEKILSNEPDGSFIVRDSSDDHYIFSLTFKLNECIRHVRIEHDQGNFSFGCCTKFKSQTIVEFIENAVEHSRTGRYLFFFHRRPVIGPVRVQLLHPVSRFKHIQSLQHMCRFVILKAVRRDLIPSLPLPRRMVDYLNTPHYYSEHPIDVDEPAVAEEVSVVNGEDDGQENNNLHSNNYILVQNQLNTGQS